MRCSNACLLHHIVFQHRNPSHVKRYASCIKSTYVQTGKVHCMWLLMSQSLIPLSRTKTLWPINWLEKNLCQILYWALSTKGLWMLPRKKLVWQEELWCDTLCSWTGVSALSWVSGPQGQKYRGPGMPWIHRNKQVNEVMPCLWCPAPIRSLAVQLTSPKVMDFLRNKHLPLLLTKR